MRIEDLPSEYIADIDWGALEAQKNYVADRTVALWQRTPDGPTLGSATCVEIGSELLLMTAGHNLWDARSWEDVEILLPQPVAERTPMLGWWFSNDDGEVPDVGCIRIPRDTLGRGDLNAIRLEHFLLDGVHEDNRAHWMHGFPLAGVFYEDGERNMLSLGGVSISRRVRETSRTETSPETYIFQYPPDALVNDCCHPRGMSGGGIWSKPTYRDVPAGAWSPAMARIVAIHRTYDEAVREVRATPVRKWLSLVADWLPELSGEVEAMPGW